MFHRVRLGSDTLGRIAGHILSQQSFYPLYPPAEEMNLDLELWARYASLDVTPHILILPSDLRCFIKVIHSLSANEIHVRLTVFSVLKL
jgi:DNA polymerase alpha-primase complex, polymerase-associated subunit B